MSASLKSRERGSALRLGMAGTGRGGRAMQAKAPLPEKLLTRCSKSGLRARKHVGSAAGVTAVTAGRGERGQPCFGVPRSVGEQEGVACTTARADHSREGTNESWPCSVASRVLCVAAAELAGAEKTSQRVTNRGLESWSWVAARLHLAGAGAAEGSVCSAAGTGSQLQVWQHPGGFSCQVPHGSRNDPG